jgi:NAD(P)-dependent dehydrogenase (short-subunit alcohol dehydrogenase family)
LLLVRETIVRTVVVVGATQGTGREIAAEYARRGDRVYITGRDGGRAAAVAAELPGEAHGLALDLTRPEGIAAALAPVERVDRVVVVGMVRDRNTLAGFDVTTASDLAVTKIVGYTAVAAALRDRMSPDASVLLFGGLAKDFPYPGSTTLTAVNAAVTGMVRTLSVELAPVRVNAIHTFMIEDSPYWRDNEELLIQSRKLALTGRLATMSDVVEAVTFLLEHPVANGIDLRLDGGRA